MAQTSIDHAAAATGAKPVLSERHLALFGAIVQQFAACELTVQQAMAKAAGTDCGTWGWCESARASFEARRWRGSHLRMTLSRGLTGALKRAFQCLPPSP